jgi:hypothetical protein
MRIIALSLVFKYNIANWEKPNVEKTNAAYAALASIPALKDRVFTARKKRINHVNLFDLNAIKLQKRHQIQKVTVF